MSGINVIINAISYVLIAFVAISLVVSSIMIGIITYISVLERTKEIGFKMVENELERIPKEKVRKIAKDNIDDIKNSNRRDFRF